MNEHDEFEKDFTSKEYLDYRYKYMYHGRKRARIEARRRWKPTEEKVERWLGIPFMFCVVAISIFGHLFVGMGFAAIGLFIWFWIEAGAIDREYKKVLAEGGDALTENELKHLNELAEGPARRRAEAAARTKAAQERVAKGIETTSIHELHEAAKAASRAEAVQNNARIATMLHAAQNKSAAAEPEPETDIERLQGITTEHIDAYITRLNEMDKEKRNARN